MNLNLEERLMEYLDHGARWPVPILWLWDFIVDWHYRIWLRGYCALYGCKLHYSGYNLPDDCYEWWCERCDANGINHIVYGPHDKFYNDEPFHNLLKALTGK